MRNRAIVALFCFALGMVSALAAMAQTRQFISSEAAETYQLAESCLNTNGYSDGDTLYSSKYSACLPRVQEILNNLGEESNQCLSQCVTNKPDSTNCDVCVRNYSAGGYTERTYSACDSFCVPKSPGLCGQCTNTRDQKKAEVESAIEAAIEDWQAVHPAVAPELQTIAPPPQTEQPSASAENPAPEPAVTTKTLSVGEDIKEGETVTTGKNERIIIAFSDGSTVQIEANSSFKLIGKDEAKTLKGKFQFFFTKLVQGRKYTIRTSNATVSIRGTKFSVNTRKNKTTVQVTEGVVAVSDAKQKKTINVNAGYQISVNGKKVGKAKQLRLK